MKNALISSFSLLSLLTLSSVASASEIPGNCIAMNDPVMLKAETSPSGKVHVQVIYTRSTTEAEKGDEVVLSTPTGKPVPLSSNVTVEKMSVSGTIVVTLTATKKDPSARDEPLWTLNMVRSGNSVKAEFIGSNYAPARSKFECDVSFMEALEE